MHGHSNFSQGGNFNDILHVWKNYGLVPQDVYAGLEYGEEEHKHGEVSNLLKSYMDVIIKNRNRTVSTAWKKGFDGILDAYFGEDPTKFEYKDKQETPKEFAKENLKINPDDYVQLTSYTHHPFYSSYIIQIPDNWTLSSVYNVTLKELEEVADNSLKNGGTFAWASDVSEKGFSFKKGLAIVPEIIAENIADDSERAKWDKLKKSDKEKKIYSFKSPQKEKTITQEMRQKAYDNYQTTDDHGMHIVGLYKDQKGTEYYKVKNSWNTNNPYDGFFYASKAFFQYKTMSIMVNKKDIPAPLRKKLGL
jgi:bleomycin hydrolase